MFAKSVDRQSKDKMLVQFLVLNKSVLEGELSIPHGSSLNDFLNNENSFIEIETSSESIRLIAKSSIVEAREIMRAPSAKSDPYAVLRIQKGASPQEIRDAWAKRLKACHPDKMAALGVDEEIEYAARKATQKINMAYNDIIAEIRERANASRQHGKPQTGESVSVYY